MSTKKELELNDIPEATETDVEAEAPKARAPRRVEPQKKLEEAKVISDAKIPSGQLLVEKGRQFIMTLSEQPLLPTMIPAQAGNDQGIKEFEIQGVKVHVPAGKPVSVPESIALLIRDIYGY